MAIVLLLKMESEEEQEQLLSGEEAEGLTLNLHGELPSVLYANKNGELDNGRGASTSGQDSQSSDADHHVIVRNSAGSSSLFETKFGKLCYNLGQTWFIKETLILLKLGIPSVSLHSIKSTETIMDRPWLVSQARPFT